MSRILPAHTANIVDPVVGTARIDLQNHIITGLGLRLAASSFSLLDVGSLLTRTIPRPVPGHEVGKRSGANRAMRAGWWIPATLRRAS
jgi:hypothetical protein